LIEDLKLKDVLAWTTLSEEVACSPDFIDRFQAGCEAAAPFVRFLTTALDLPLGVRKFAGQSYLNSRATITHLPLDLTRRQPGREK